MNQHTEKNDENLVRLTLLGDESAYEELVSVISARLWGRLIR